MIIICAMNFGQTLRALRKSAGLTQEEFAKKMGITQTAVAHYERNARKPEMEKLPEIAKVLGVTIDKLFDAASPAANGATTKKRVHKNSREVKIQELFNKLTPAKQQNLFKLVKELVKK